MRVHLSHRFMDLTPYFDRTFLGNTLLAWSWAAGVVLAIALALWIVRTVVLHRLERLAGRTSTYLDDLLVVLLRRTRFVLLAWVAITVALRMLTFSPTWRDLLHTFGVIAFLLQLGIWANGLIDVYLLRYTQEKAADATTKTTFRVIAFGVRVAAWSVLLLVALDNMGVDVTALITGLGIGGVAVALAVQNILGDVLAALAIMLDKPFIVGDFIVVGSEVGSVEQIGVKTTRIRSLSGEQIIFSNAELLKSRIRNFKRMEERRILFRFGVLYGTPAPLLRRVPEIAKEAVVRLEGTRFDRAHFAGFGDSSLDFEVVYFVLSPEYNRYMDLQQEINLYLLETFRSLGIDFAFPTRTVHLDGRLQGAADDLSRASDPAPDRP